MCTGTYSITIYCGYSLDFIIGYFKVFSNVIFNFDSYEISIGFGDDNSKTSSGFIVWLYIDRESLCTGASLYDSTPL